MRRPLLLLAAVSLLHLGAQLTAPDGWVSGLTQVLLMPCVAWVLIAGLPGAADRRDRLVRLTLVALFCSWLGDTVPRFLSGDPAFLAMVAFFLLAQIAYIAAFWPFRDRCLVRRSPPAVAPYAVAFVVLVVLCREGAGPLFVPVLAYGLALATMAVLATGLRTPAGLGGALFFCSDGLIALGAFADLDLPAGNGFWVMLTYVVGQTLLALGVRHTLSGPHPH